MHSLSFPSCGKRSSAPFALPAGFALIELLTVIAIIGVLAAILIPVVGSMRVKAERTASASNLRQWSQALLLYANENAKRIPYEGGFDQPSWNQTALPAEEHSWFNVLPPYVGEKPLRELSSASEREVMVRTSSIHFSPGAEADSRENRRRPFFSYMMNSQIYSGDGPSNSGNNLIRLTVIPEPAKTIFMTETRSSEDDGAPNEGAGRVARSKGRNNSISFRYGGQTNVVFLDGHLETVESEFLYNFGRDPAASGGQLDDYIWFPWSET